MIEMIETEIESDRDSAWMSCLITIRIKVMQIRKVEIF